MLHLGNTNPLYACTIKGRPLLALNCVRDLGVTMSKNLFLHDHIKQIIANFRRKLFIVRKFFHYIDKFILKTLCLIYLRPTIEYGSALWSPQNKFLIDDQRSLKDKALTLCHFKIVLKSLDGRRVCSDLTYYNSILLNFTRLNVANIFRSKIRINHMGH